MCARGCSFGAYFSTQAVTLPAARKTGNLTLLSDQVVTNLDYDPKTRRVTGVRVVDANTQEAKVHTARIVFVCASAMASTQILLNSRLPGSERSFADSSGLLGHYIMDHAFRTSFWGTVPDPALNEFIAYGRRPKRRLYPALPQFGRPGCRCRFFCAAYGMQGAAWRNPANPRGFGAAMKESMRGYEPWMINFSAFGECLPYKDNTLSLNPAKLDRFGVPLAVFSVTFRDNEQKMLRDAALQGEAMMKAAGADERGLVE